MELGFLKRLRESDLWPRVGWIYGTSSGALAGTMAALDRLDDLEDFMLRLQPEDTFRPHSLWRLPLLGSHDYRLPETVAERIGDLVPLSRELAEGTDRDDGLCDRCQQRRARTRCAHVRARVLVAHDAAGDDGAGDPRLRRGERARPAAAGRRPNRNRRRLGAQLPARACVPRSRASS